MAMSSNGATARGIVDQLSTMRFHSPRKFIERCQHLGGRSLEKPPTSVRKQRGAAKQQWYAIEFSTVVGNIPGSVTDRAHMVRVMVRD